MIFKEFIGVFLTLICVLLLWIKKKKSTRTENFPGPRGIPLLGNLLQIVKKPHEKFSEWAEKYGALYEVRFGNQRAIVLSDTKSVKNVFGQFNSTGKYHTDTVLLVSRGPYGLVNSEGKSWAELRKFCVANLKTFGFGKQSLEPLIADDANELLKWIDINTQKSDGDSVSILQVLKNYANNVLWTLVNGKRIEADNAALNELMDTFEKCFQKTIYSGLAFLTWIKYLAPSASGFNDFDKITLDISSFINKKIEEHRGTYLSGVTRDLIDCYIEKMEDTVDPNSVFYGGLGDRNFSASIMELFIAGRESTAHTINYACIQLCIHNDVQEKVYREISKVIGEREPAVADKFNMPFTEAVILETLRHNSLTPVGALHKTLDDIVYEGRRIPEGVVLIPNLYHIHYSKSIWGDPENFRPQRFLQSGNQWLRDNVLPFQAGRRSCVAEPLARDIIFLFLVKIVQNYKIKRDERIPIDEYLEVEVGFVRRTGPRKMYFEKRRKT